jgi:hypothetical protein
MSDGRGKRHSFTPDEDALIVQQANGVLPISLYKLITTLGTSSQALERRARELGVEIRKQQSWSRLERMRRLEVERKLVLELEDDGLPHDYSPQLRIPENDDRLLQRLRQYHGDG